MCLSIVNIYTSTINRQSVAAKIDAAFKFRISDYNEINIFLHTVNAICANISVMDSYIALLKILGFKKILRQHNK